jgi:hypothetical protein
MARFFSYFLTEVDKADKAQIGPKPAGNTVVDP